MNSVAGTCCITVHTKGHSILSTFCPCDMSHEVQQVELRATCHGDRMSPKLMLHNHDNISSHKGDVSLQHVPATFLCVCKRYDFVPPTSPHYTSPLQVPQCVLHKFLSLLYVAALCRCDMFLLHDPSCLPTLMETCSVDLTLKSVNKILEWDYRYSNKTSLVVILHGTICF